MNKTKILLISLIAVLLLLAGCTQPKDYDLPLNGKTKGDLSAPITIVEYSDFECSFCGKFYRETMPRIEEGYVATGKAKIEFRHFPLPPEYHPNAQLAALASECANEQGKFWQMHDLLFENQSSLSFEKMKSFAVQLELNTEQFNECLETTKYADKITQDSQQGIADGVKGTPSFLINGVFVEGAKSFNEFKTIIDGELAKTGN